MVQESSAAGRWWGILEPRSIRNLPPFGTATRVPLSGIAE